MDFPSIEDYGDTEDDLKNRAKKILGFARDADIDDENLKKVFRRKAKETHPDINPQKEKSTEYFKLILQAKNYLKGEKKNKRLLKDNELVESYLEEPVQEIEKSYRDLMKAYERWRRDHFYDMENESIWPNSE